MATYLKTTSKLFERLVLNSVSSGSANGSATSSSSSSSVGSSSEPSLRDLICPVCRALLREPVSLPCSHNLCLGCLRATLGHLENKNSTSSSGGTNLLCCPLCNQRLGSWLRSRRKPESLVNLELWKHIRKRYPEEAEQAASAGPLIQAAAAAAAAAAATCGNDARGDPEYLPKKLIKSAGKIKKEYEIKEEMRRQVAEEEMRRQREKERLANEALLRQIQEQEKQQKLYQLAQEQFLAQTLAKNEVMGQNKSKLDLYNSKFAPNQKISNRSKDAIDTKKQNVVLASKIRSDRYNASLKSSSSNMQKDSYDPFRCQKSVPIHNAVTRVVTHQNRLNQLNNSAYLATGELVSTSSNIFGLQTKEELHVPSDVISDKKKKLGVEVCVTNIEGEERIGSAESAGSHDSINQEIHHFKPIKALPRTPLKITLDGRQIDPKLIRVLPTFKRVSNAVPKPPVQTHPKKVFGCSWSAFKRIYHKHHGQHKDIPTTNQPRTKKTDKKSEQTRNVSKSSRATAQDQLSEGNAEESFDTNKNYTKNISKTVNGTTKVSKKLNLDEEANTTNSVKQTRKRAPKVRNGQLLSKQKLPSKRKEIEVVDIDDDYDNSNNENDDDNQKVSNNHAGTPNPISITPKNQDRPLSPVLEIIENIAERIKRRNTSRTTCYAENSQSAIDKMITSEKLKSKKPSSTARNKKTKKPSSPIKPKVRTKIEKVIPLTSQIKRLAARSSKKPRYTEDSESEEEYFERRRLEEQLKLEASEAAELQRSLANMITPPPATIKKSSKSSKSKKPKPSKKKTTPVVDNIHTEIEDVKTVIEEAPKVRKTSKDRASKRPVTKMQEDSESDEEDASSSPPKKPRKPATKNKKPKQNKKKVIPVKKSKKTDIDEADAIREQERLEQLAIQERKDLELALKLQEQFNAMERIAGRTRRGATARPASPVLEDLVQIRPQRKTVK